MTALEHSNNNILLEDILAEGDFDAVIQKYNLIELDSFFCKFKEFSPPSTENGIDLNCKNVDYDYKPDNDILDKIKNLYYDKFSNSYQLGLITEDLKLIPLNAFLYYFNDKENTKEIFDIETLIDYYKDEIPKHLQCGTMIEVRDNVDSYHSEFQDNAEISFSGTPDIKGYYKELTEFNESRVFEIFKRAAEQSKENLLADYLKDCIKEINRQRDKSMTKEELSNA